MLQDSAARTITQIREDRLGELADAATREQVTADALAGLAAVIRQAEIPVARWEPIWNAIAQRLSRDAAESRFRAHQATERAEDVRAAIDARQRVGA
jgi:hypothetical protein